MITVPPVWDTWTKNLRYPTPEGHSQAIALMTARPHSFSQLSMFEMIAITQQIRAGSQIVVEKRVSDDLLLSDIEGVKFEDLAWPSLSLEFFFEDPRIPNALLQKRTMNTLMKELESFPALRPFFDVTDMDQPFVRVLVQEQANPVASQMNLTAEEMNRFALDGHEVGPMPIHTIQDLVHEQMNHDEQLGLQALVVLMYKVLIYAQIPALAPKEVGKNSLHHGGKPGVKNRPRRPILRVVDLPKPYRDSHQHKEEKGTHEFRGRRGHFHYYRSEKFVNRKGTFDYFPPKLGPDGTLPPIRFRVKKLNT